jgi:esterase/lipase
MDHSPYIRKTESADTAVLMIHGIMGTPRHFDGFLEILPESWDVYNILLDGHGKTVRDFNKTSMKKWRTQVQGWIRELSGRYQKIVVIAHSMGTLLSMEAARMYPEKIEKMIFLAPPLKIFMRPVMVKYSAKVIFGTINEGEEREAAVARGNSIAPEKRVWRYLGNIPRLLELMGLSRRCRRIPVQVPCLVFLSGKDELIPIASGKYLPDCQKIILPQSGHFYYTPAEWAIIEQRAKEFLQ